MAETFKIPYELKNASVPLARLVDAVVLGSDTAESYTVPAGTRFVLLSATNPFWVRVGATAVVPTTEVADGSAPAYVPSTAQMIVEEGTVLSFIRPSGTASTISISRYS